MANVEPLLVYPEAEFQKALIALVKDVLKGHPFLVLERFGLDIAVFTQGNNPRFFEVKAFRGQRMGGVGFGNGRGVGQQVDMLLSAEDLLCLLDRFVRWAFVDATQPSGSRRFALFSCETAKRSVMGTVARGKQNNLKLSALGSLLVSWQDFADQVATFLTV